MSKNTRPLVRRIECPFSLDFSSRIGEIGLAFTDQLGMFHEEDVMWRRQEVQRDFFWAGVVAGLAIFGLAIVGFLLGTEMGRNTRTRLGQTYQRVRSRINGSTESRESPAEADIE